MQQNRSDDGSELVRSLGEALEENSKSVGAKEERDVEDGWLTRGRESESVDTRLRAGRLPSKAWSLEGKSKRRKKGSLVARTHRSPPKSPNRFP